MKKQPLLLLTGLCFALSAYKPCQAQNAFSGISFCDSSYIILDTAGIVSVNGNVLAQNAWRFGLNIHNAGTIRLNDTLWCQTGKLFLTSTNALGDEDLGEEYTYTVAVQKPYGTLQGIDSARNKAIAGDSSVYFATLATDGQTVLYKDISVLQSANVSQGRLLLNKNEIFLSDTVMDWFDYGMLTGEDSQGLHAVYDSLYYNADSAGRVVVYKLVKSGSDLTNSGNLGVQMSGNLNYVRTIRRHYPLTDVTNGGLRHHFVLNAYGFISKSDSALAMPDSLNLRYRNVDMGTFEEDSLAIFTRKDGSASWEYLAGNVQADLNLVGGGPTTIVTAPGEETTLAERHCDHLPQVFAGPDRSVCYGTNYIINPVYQEYNDYTIGRYLWKSDLDITDQAGNMTISLPADTLGTYQFIIAITDQRACRNADTINISIIEGPRPGIAFPDNNRNTFCAGDTVHLLNNSTPTGTDPIVDYHWDLGVYGTSADSTVDQAWQQTGVQRITLEAISALGCRADTQRMIHVYSYPVVDFRAGTNCENTEVELTNLSVADTANGDHLRYAQWILADTTLDRDAGAGEDLGLRWDFPAYGIQNVQLTVTSSAGCQSVTDKELLIPRPSIPGFTVDGLCAGQALTFTNTTLPGDGTPIFNWNFGDGSANAQTVSLTEPVEHTYTEDGSYNVILTVITTANCRDTFVRPILISRPLHADFEFTSACSGQLVGFTNLSETADSVYWNFGQGRFSNLLNPVVSFSGDGVFPVSLSVWSVDGCESSVTKNVSIWPLPTPSYSASSICFGQPAVFNNTSFGATSYQWDFGDGGTSMERNPSHLYLNFQPTYPVRLIAQSAQGCTDTLFSDYTIRPLPVTNIPADIIETCGNSYLLDGGSNVSFLWQDNSTSPTHLATSSGRYTLVVRNAEGCQRTQVVDVTLSGRVLPNLGPDRNECGKALLKPGNSSFQFQWSDGTTYPELLVTETGQYAVTITDPAIATADNPAQCIGYDTVNLTILPLPLVDLADTYTSCAGFPVLLNAGAFPTVVWNGTTNQNPLPVNASGIYRVTITGTNGCQNADTTEVTIYPAPNVYTTNFDITACNTARLAYLATDGIEWLWSTGSSTSEAAVNYSGEVWAQVENSFGCTRRDTFRVLVNTIDPIRLGSDTAICTGKTLRLDGGYDTYTYRWGNHLTTRTIEVSEAGIYTVTGTNNVGCTASDTILVSIKTAPVVILGNDIQICMNDTLTLNATNANSVYQWETTSGFTSSRPTYETIMADTISVLVTNTNGCSAADTIVVSQTDYTLITNFVAPSDGKAHDTLYFVGLCSPEPVVYTWSFGNGGRAEGAETSCIYTQPGTYTATLHASNGICSGTDSKEILIEGYNKYYLIGQGMYDNAFSFKGIAEGNLYPNPNGGTFFFDLSLTDELETQLLLFDMQGRLLDLRHIGKTTHFTAEYNYTQLQAGIYFLRAIAGSSQKVYKIVITR